MYTLRSAVTTAMNKMPGMPHLELRYYLTSHSTKDILNAYVSLDPVKAMGSYFDQVRPLLRVCGNEPNTWVSLLLKWHSDSPRAVCGDTKK